MADNDDLPEAHELPIPPDAQQVGGHETAVAVTAHDDTGGVGDAEADRAVDRGLQ